MKNFIVSLNAAGIGSRTFFGHDHLNWSCLLWLFVTVTVCDHLKLKTGWSLFKNHQISTAGDCNPVTKLVFVYFSLERIGLARGLFTLRWVFPLQCSLACYPIALIPCWDVVKNHFWWPGLGKRLQCLLMFLIFVH